MKTTVMHLDNLNVIQLRSHRLTTPDEYEFAGTAKKKTEYHPGRCLS